MKKRHLAYGVLAAVAIAGAATVGSHYHYQISAQDTNHTTHAIESQANDPLPAKRIGPADIYPPSWTHPTLDQETANNVQGTLCNPSWSTKSIRPPASYTTAPKSKFSCPALPLRGIFLEYRHGNHADIWNAKNHSPKPLRKSYYVKRHYAANRKN